MEDYSVILGGAGTRIPDAVILAHFVYLFLIVYEAERRAMFMPEQKDLTRERMMRPLRQSYLALDRSRKASE